MMINSEDFLRIIQNIDGKNQQHFGQLLDSCGSRLGAFFF